MSTYLLLYSGSDLPETEEESDDGRGGRGDALVDGNPFTSNAKSVSPDGAVSDRPIGPMASGYSMIKARSKDEAVEMAKDRPAKLSSANISIFEVL